MPVAGPTQQTAAGETAHQGAGEEILAAQPVGIAGKVQVQAVLYFLPALEPVACHQERPGLRQQCRGLCFALVPGHELPIAAHVLGNVGRARAPWYTFTGDQMLEQLWVLPGTRQGEPASATDSCSSRGPG